MLNEIMGTDIGSSVKSSKESIYYRITHNKKKYILKIIPTAYVKDYKKEKCIESTLDAVGNFWVLLKNAKKI